MRIEHRKLFRFLLSGAPAFALAIPLNYALVHWAGLGKGWAYALVLALQTTVNFLICRAFVFATRPDARIGRDFFIFLHGNILFRLADWLIYVLLTKYAGLPYLAVQLFNVALFAFLKFEFAKRVFEPRK